MSIARRPPRTSQFQIEAHIFSSIVPHLFVLETRTFFCLAKQLACSYNVATFKNRFFVKGRRRPSMTEKVKGSVLVVGGGISGMQSALDLANSGYYVYLLEKSPSIGGAMAQLDKTFPTNDCAM